MSTGCQFYNVPAVVTEFDDIVLVAMALSVHDEAEESVVLLLSIYHRVSPEEPMAAVLTWERAGQRHPQGIKSGQHMYIQTPPRNLNIR